VTIISTLLIYLYTVVNYTYEVDQWRAHDCEGQETKFSCNDSTYFWVRLQNLEKTTISFVMSVFVHRSVRPSVRPSVRMEQLSSY